jgi:hypothetical protein
MPRALLPLLLVATILPACGDTRKCDSNDICDSVGDTFGTIREADLEVESLIYNFTSSAWNYTVRLAGWADAVQLGIFWTDGTDEIEELHTLRQLNYDPNGAWDEWGGTVNVVTEDAGVGETVFTASKEASMTWMAAAYKAGIFTDCGVKANTDASTAHWDRYGCHAM